MLAAEAGGVQWLGPETTFVYGFAVLVKIIPGAELLMRPPLPPWGRNGLLPPLVRLELVLGTNEGIALMLLAPVAVIPAVAWVDYYFGW